MIDLMETKDKLAQGLKNNDVSEIDIEIRQKIIATIMTEQTKAGEGALLDPCRVWKGKKAERGHGRVRLYGQWWLVHRLIWTLQYGTIPKGFVVYHKCDNNSCCNPAHLGCCPQHRVLASKNGGIE